MPDTARAERWKQELQNLPSTWPQSVQDQVADPQVRAAMARAYQVGGSVQGISRHTGRSLEVVRLILKATRVLRSQPIRSRTRMADAETRLRARVRRAKAGTRLPALAALARQLGLGPSAMQKVVARLRHDGLLRYIPGLGLVVTDPANPPAAPANPADATRHSWHRGSRNPQVIEARKTVLARIADGTYPEQHHLPRAADLHRELGVTPGGLERALSPLKEHGLIHARKGAGTTVLRGSRRRAADWLAEQNGLPISEPPPARLPTPETRTASRPHPGQAPQGA